MHLETTQAVTINFGTPLVLLVGSYHGDCEAIFTFSGNGFSAKGENMSATLQAGEYATVSVEWKDAGGRTVAVEDGSVNWKSSDTSICTVTQASGNPAIANLYAPGPIGTVSIQATGDADLGQGVQTVTATLQVEVITGEAVAGDITFTQSPSQEHPAPPPRKR